MATPDTATPTAQAAGDATPVQAPAAPATPAAPQAPAAQAWSLDTWKEDQWDALPERIRLAAETRYKGQYEPKLTEAQQALAQREADIAAAKREAQEARAAHLRGDPYAAAQAREAQEKLTALQKEFETYKGQWSEQVLNEKWKAEAERANAAFNKEWEAATARELRIMHPWYEAQVNGQPNPRHDAARAKIADEMDNQFWAIASAGGKPSEHPLGAIPRAFFLIASGLNPAQRASLLTQIAEGVDPMVALDKAGEPPARVPSPAARATPGAPGAPASAPRPDQTVPRGERGTGSSWFTAAKAATRTVPNAR